MAKKQKFNPLVLIFYLISAGLITMFFGEAYGVYFGSIIGTLSIIFLIGFIRE